MIAGLYLRLAVAAAIASVLAGAVWLHNGWIKAGRQESLQQGRAEVQAISGHGGLRFLALAADHGSQLCRGLE